jgi:hypothetical protein
MSSKLAAKNKVRRIFGGLAMSPEFKSIARTEEQESPTASLFSFVL